MQTVIQATPHQLNQLKKAYATAIKNPPPAYALFAAKLPDVSITAYRSGKVLFQGKGHARESAKWSKLFQPKRPKKHRSSSAATTTALLPQGLKDWSVLGSDEVGAGAYFGPLTTAAVYISQDNLDWVRQLGVADSKTLTDHDMIKMAPKIIAHLPHHVVNLLPEKYNAIQPQNNVNQMKAISHNFALHKVLEKIAPQKPQAILIDQFALPQTYYKYLTNANQQPIVRENVYFTTKAEQYHLSVAAASILARYVELQTMKKLSAEVGITLPIGAGKAVDLVAAELLRRQVDLRQYAKLHFANTQKAQKLVK